MKQTNKNMYRWALVVFIFSLTISGAPVKVFAAETGSYGGKPAKPGEGNDHTSQWFIYKALPPAEKREDEIRVINNSDSPLTLKLYPADSAKSSDGGFALEQEVEERDEVGKWITLSTSEVTVEPHAEQIVPFTIQIPEDAKVDPGEHAGGILIQEKKEVPKLVEGGIQLSTRIGIRVYVTVPGPIVEKLSVDEFFFKQVPGGAHTNWSTEAEIKNSGTVREDITIVTHVESAYPWLDRLFDRNRLLPANNERGMQVLRDDTLRSAFEFSTPAVSYLKGSTTVVYVDQHGKKQTLKSPDIYQWVLPPQKQLFIIGALAVSSLIALILLVIAIIRLVRRLRKALALLKNQEIAAAPEVVAPVKKPANTTKKTVTKKKVAKKATAPKKNRKNNDAISE